MACQGQELGVAVVPPTMRVCVFFPQNGTTAKPKTDWSY